MSPVVKKRNSHVRISVLNCQKKIAVDSILLSKIRKVIRMTLVSEAPKTGPREISVCLADADTIRMLNRKYFRRGSLTDVIAFNTGDVMVCTDAAIMNSGVFHTERSYELLLYVAHGMLHIMGYDDNTPARSRAMQSRAEAVLKSCGVKDGNL